MTEIGIDCVDLDRFENMDPAFKEKVFTSHEIEYCDSFASAAEHYAARFAAKEAVKKALSAYGETLSFKEIEVQNLDDGRPRIHLHKKMEKSVHINISLSHSRTTAVAIVLVSQEGDSNHGRK